MNKQMLKMQFQQKQEYCFKISNVEQNDSSNISGPGEYCLQTMPERHEIV